MKKKLMKLMASALTIATLFSLTVPAFASRGEVVEEEFGVEGEDISSSEIKEEKIVETDDEGNVYYYEIKDGKLTTAVVYTNGYLDISVREFVEGGSDLISTKTSQLDNFNDERSALSETTAEDIIKNAALDMSDATITYVDDNSREDRDVQYSIDEQKATKFRQTLSDLRHYDYSRRYFLQQISIQTMVIKLLICMVVT